MRKGRENWSVYKSCVTSHVMAKNSDFIKYCRKPQKDFRLASGDMSSLLERFLRKQSLHK